MISLEGVGSSALLHLLTVPKLISAGFPVLQNNLDPMNVIIKETIVFQKTIFVREQRTSQTVVIEILQVMDYLPKRQRIPAPG